MLDSQAPSIPLKTYAYNEIRYRMLCNTKPDDAKALLTLAQEDIDRHCISSSSGKACWKGLWRTHSGSNKLGLTPTR